MCLSTGFVNLSSLSEAKTLEPKALGVGVHTYARVSNTHYDYFLRVYDWMLRERWGVRQKQVTAWASGLMLSLYEKIRFRIINNYLLEDIRFMISRIFVIQEILVRPRSLFDTTGRSYWGANLVILLRWQPSITRAIYLPLAPNRLVGRTIT